MTPVQPSAVTVSSVLRHLVAWGLPGGPSKALDVGPEDATQTSDWSELAAEARWHRCTGTAIAAMDAGALAPVPQGLRDALHVHHLTLLQQTLNAEADAVRTVRTLDRHGIDVRILKGLATAHLDHDDPAQRMTSDVDLLVRHDELDAATAALTTWIDETLSVPDRRRRHAARYGKDRTLKLLDGGWLDLHRLLVPGYWGLSLDHDRFFDSGDTLVVAETTITALAPHDRLLHALLHAGATDAIKVQSMRDVIVLAGTVGTTAITDDQSLRPVHGLLALGVRRVAALFEIDFGLNTWAAEVTPTSRERMALRTRRLRGSRDHWSGPLALPLHRWPGYLWPLVSPSPAYRSWYRRSSIGHLSSAKTAVKGRR